MPRQNIKREMREMPTYANNSEESFQATAFFSFPRINALMDSVDNGICFSEPGMSEEVKP
jgi:hypothetical protein